MTTSSLPNRLSARHAGATSFPRASTRWTSRPRVRSGLAAAELMVAAVLFLAGVSLVAHTSFKSQRIQLDGEHYRVAVDYLACVLEDVEAASTDQREEVLEQLEVPAWIANRLGEDVALTWEIADRQSAQHVDLQLNWMRPGDAPAVELTGVFLKPPKSNPLPKSEALSSEKVSKTNSTKPTSVSNGLDLQTAGEDQ